jgi:predicted DNA-binding transcriptional regulator AlpA
VASKPLSREHEIVLQRFLELSPVEQLETYRAMRDLLGARLRLVKRDDTVEERAASLGIFSRVAAHLHLPEGTAPTPTQFNAVCRELDLGWNSSRFIRAWGRWRFGKDAFLGQDHDSAPRHNLHRTVGHKLRRHEAPLRAVRLWLATEPTERSWGAYGDWAREYNSDLKSGDLPVNQTAANLAAQMGMMWPDLVRYAAGEIQLGEARPRIKKVRKHYCRGPHDLVATGDLAAILDCPKPTASRHAARHAFPQPVLDLPGGRLWVRSDVEAYSQERKVPERRRNEFRSFYMTAAEVAKALGVSERMVRDRGAHLPEPVLNLGTVTLWLSSEVEARRPNPLGR